MEVTKLEPQFYPCKPPKRVASAIQGLAVYTSSTMAGLATSLPPSPWHMGPPHALYVSSCWEGSGELLSWKTTGE